MYNLDPLYNELLEHEKNTNAVNVAIWSKLADFQGKFPKLFNEGNKCYLSYQQVEGSYRIGDFEIIIQVFPSTINMRWSFEVKRYTINERFDTVSCSSITKQDLEEAIVRKISKLTKEQDHYKESLMPLAELLGVQ